jgi:hypothetical protein
VRWLAARRYELVGVPTGTANGMLVGVPTGTGTIILNCFFDDQAVRSQQNPRDEAQIPSRRNKMCCIFRFSPERSHALPATKTESDSPMSP